MKRYTRCAAEPFELDTDTSYYNNFLNDKDLKYMQDAKNKTGEVVMMSPNQYYSECANNIFKDTTVAKLKQQREASHELSGESTLSKYISDMKKGDKFPLCYLNYADSSQEGLHRMYAAGEAFGWDTKFPVLVVKVFDQERENQLILMRNCRDFENYDLRKLIEDACESISDWSAPVPIDVCIQIRDAIKSLAKSENNVDIDVDVEIKMIEGHPRVDVYLLEYDGYELSSASNSSRTWLEDLYDLDVDDDPDFDADVYNNYYNDHIQ